MLNFSNDSLAYFNNLDTVQNVENILIHGTESSHQLMKYKEGGFKKLLRYLIENVEYQVNLGESNV